MGKTKDDVFFRASRKLLSFLPFKLRKSLVKNIAEVMNVNLLSSAYESIGVSKYQSFYISGEEFLLQEVLPKLFQKKDIVVFDVGANVGNYALHINKSNPKASIFCFEPVPTTFKLLEKNTKNFQNIKCINIGLGDTVGKLNIYTYKDNVVSPHATIYKEVISDLHNAKDDYVAYHADISTLDKFCSDNGITNIDLLKIDTEGNEYAVLKGTSELIKEKRLKVIQFEFGEMNIVAKVFLKDFYVLLGDFNIYRLDTKRLIPLFPYRSVNEIFGYQNLVAIRKDIDLLEFNRN